jgi:hypothetical protein
VLLDDAVDVDQLLLQVRGHAEAEELRQLGGALRPLP